MRQEFEAFVRNAPGAAQDEGTHAIRSDDYGDERQKGIIDKRPGVDGYFVEAKEKGDHGRHDGVKTKKWRKGDENTDRKSKRRPLGWIIDRKQTAKCRAKHSILAADFRG